MSQNSEIRAGYRALQVAILAISVLVLGSRWLGALQSLEWAVFDRLSRRGTPKPEPRICLLEVTPRDIQTYGYPLSDILLAGALEKLATQGTIIGLDLTRSLPIGGGDARLQAAIAATGNLIGVEFGSQGPQATPKVASRAPSDVIVDRDGVRRRALLLTVTSEAAASETAAVTPTLSLAVAYRYLAVHHRWQPEPDRSTTALRLGRARFEKLTPLAGAYVRANNQGFQILPNWRARAFERFSLAEVLADDSSVLCPVVFASNNVTATSNGFYTPLSGLGGATAPLKIPNHEYHAVATAHLLAAALEGERTIASWPEPLEMLWIAFWVAGPAGIVWKLRYCPGFVGWAILTGVGALALATLAAYGAFSLGMWLPLVPCWLGSALAALVAIPLAYIWQLRELLRVRTVELQRNQELALLGKLMAGVSHDVRNPTQYILNFVEVCLRRLEDIPSDRRSRWQGRLEGIATSAKTIEQVVQGLLATSQEPRPISIVPNQTLNTICDLVAHGKAIAIEKDLDPALDREVALACGINTVVFNLLNNAVDAVAARPQPSVRLQARDRGNHLELQIWDNGEGIPADLLQEQRLFAAFATTKPWGTGLGLFTVRELLDRCGGTIAVETDSRSWTQFTIRLPKRAWKTPAALPE